ncbi:RNA-guided pseudouridylation complex pseudouridine synthase subunit Cbf5, partial [Candidatus Bathyarchaeota archaeon]|nr:RNA-guided pseudouridylation complex pseudouridine synthase subunit Cbf5 [Candidatus Bathyarchaeota archaeon]
MSLRPPWEIDRNIIVRAEEETDPSFGCPPEQRPIEKHIRFGVINLDKPPGPTSHEVVSWVKRILDLDRAGHGGTLDPKVTGVLPITLEEATKVVQALLESGKEYICIMKTHGEEREEKVVEVLKLFEGRIYQRPPIRASVKRRLRTRTIYRIEYLEGDGRNWLFKVACESGTYIRKLCVVGDTELILSNGEIIRIEDFANKFCNSIGSYNVYGDYRTLSFNKGHQVSNKILKVQKIPSPDLLVKIRTSSGAEIRLTKDHDVLVSTEEGPKWCCAGDLREGDLVFMPTKIDIEEETPYIVDLLDDDFLVDGEGVREECILGFIKKYGSIRNMERRLNIERKPFHNNSETYIKIKYIKAACDWDKIKDKINKLKTEKGRVVELNSKLINEEIMYLLGLIASDGSIIFEDWDIRPARLKFHNSEEGLIKKFVEIHENLFPSIPLYVKRMVNNVIEVDVSNPVLASIAHSLGIVSPSKNADFKPIFRLPKPLLKSFLKGYFDSDGSAQLYQYKNRCITNIDLYTINSIIAKRLYLLLKRVGINSRILKRKIYGSFKSPNEKYNVVRLRSPADKLVFIREIGSNHPKK